MAYSIELAFITIANVLSSRRREVDAVNVVFQTFLGFYKLNINGLNFSDGKLLANSFIMIFISLRDLKLTLNFRFFAIFLKYFNSLSSSFFKNVVLLP